MASSFRRRRPEATDQPTEAGSKLRLAGLKGTKPWTGGITLTSSGLRDLDAILGGGIPLGTCILLQEDHWTDSLGRALVKYWCSEALAHDQTLLIPVAEGDEDLELHAPTAKYSSDRSVNDTAPSLFPARSTINLLLDSLPKNLHLEKEEKRQLDPYQQPTGLNTLQEEDDASDQEEETADQDAEAGLEIAWQYRKEVQQERLGQASSSHSSSLSTTNVFCKSYDLSGKLSSQLSWTDMQVVLEPLAHQTCGLRCFQQLWQALQTRRASSTAGVTRILLYHSDLHLISVMLPLLLASIRLEGLPVMVLVVTESSKESNCNVAKVLRRSCDVILEAEAFATRSIYPPPPEFREFQGVLKIRKMSTLTAAAAHGGGHFADVTTSKRLIASVYGLKRDRRKLHIKLLHIPPEDFAQGGGSVGTSGVRSGAGRKDAASSCAGGSSTLDFLALPVCENPPFDHGSGEG